MTDNDLHMAPGLVYSNLDMINIQTNDQNKASSTVLSEAAEVLTTKVLTQEPDACSIPEVSKEADAVSHINTKGKAASTSDNENVQPDPHSPNFSYEKWITNMFRDPTKCRKRDSGVAYQNLNVYGFGTITDYQRTFANYPLMYLSHLGTLIGRQRKSRIDILRDFEGIVNSGEMLLVLGRPGSGCTTFLKALAGQTHGFFIDEKSKINYQGNQRTNLAFTD